MKLGPLAVRLNEVLLFSDYLLCVNEYLNWLILMNGSCKSREEEVRVSFFSLIFRFIFYKLKE
jgi:hypothetical protein